jgi:hypothetical protein
MRRRDHISADWNCDPTGLVYPVSSLARQRRAKITSPSRHWPGWACNRLRCRRVAIPTGDVFVAITQHHTRVHERDPAPSDRTRNRQKFAIRIQDKLSWGAIQNSPGLARIPTSGKWSSASLGSPGSSNTAVPAGTTPAGVFCGPARTHQRSFPELCISTFPAAHVQPLRTDSLARVPLHTSSHK